MPKQRVIPAGEFKARCLQLMDEVNRDGIELIITKRGQPVARLVPPAPPAEPQLFGCMRGSVIILDENIWDPDPELWGELGE